MTERQTVFSRWRRPPPPAFYKKPAWISIIVTIVVILVIGPVGVIYDGMSEEMKSMQAEDKENKGAIIQNQLAIKELLTRQQMLLKPVGSVLQRTGKVESFDFKKSSPKKLTPEEYSQYTTMSIEKQEAYRKYRTDITLWP